MELSDTKFGGEKVLTGIDIISKPVTKVIIKLADVNPSGAAATGTMVCRIKKASDGTTAATSNTATVSSFSDNQTGDSTANWTNTTFTFTNNTYNMLTGDKIQFEYNYDSDAGGGGGGLIGSQPTGSIVSYYHYLSNTISATHHCDNTARSGYQINTVNSSINLLNDVCKGIIVKMCDSNTSGAAASGTMVCKLQNAAGSTTYATSNTVDVTQLVNNQGATAGGGWTDVGFAFGSNSHGFALGDTLQIEYNHGGGGTSRVSIACMTPNPTIEGMAYSRNTGGTLTTDSNNDVVMDVYV